MDENPNLAAEAPPESSGPQPLVWSPAISRAKFQRCGPAQRSVQQIFLPRAETRIGQSRPTTVRTRHTYVGRSQTTRPVGRTVTPGAGQLSPGKVHSGPKQPATVADEIAAVRAAWVECQARRDRDAIYPYLTAVFALMARWDQEGRWQKSLLAALDLLTRPLHMKIGEAYSLIIYCTADPARVDAKTRSKWARVLRYADKVKPADESLKSFIKRQGGLNACAQKFARKLGRHG
jgi:hypothetical protein